VQPNNPASVPASQGQSISISLAQRRTIALPAIEGITSTITLARNDAPPGATMIVGVSKGSPVGVPSIPASHPVVFECFTMTSSANVAFTGFP
jgi:hypothetical protein